MTWRERVIAARPMRVFTLTDVRDAQSWETCAVGEQHQLHPEVVRYVVVIASGMPLVPIDPILERSGGEFAAAVYTGNMDRAEELLGKIEDRVLQLKREENT